MSTHSTQGIRDRLHMFEFMRRSKSNTVPQRIEPGLPPSSAIDISDEHESFRSDPDNTYTSESTNHASELDADICIVGAGPAGLAAAAELGRADVRLICLEKQKTLSNHALTPLENEDRRAIEFSIASLNRSESDKADTIDDTKSNVLDIRLGSRVWAGERKSDGTFELYVSDHNGSYSLNCASVIVASGSYESLLPVIGWTLHGVIGLREAETALNSSIRQKKRRMLPPQNTPGNATIVGCRIVVAGSGFKLYALARKLTKMGKTVTAIVDYQRPLDYLQTVRTMFVRPLVLMKNLFNVLLFAFPINTQIYRRARIASIHGSEAVSRVYVQRIDQLCSDTSGVTADTVCYSDGIVPHSGLFTALGAAVSISSKDGVPRASVDSEGRTSVDKLLAAGEAIEEMLPSTAANTGVVAARAALAEIATPAPQTMKKAQLETLLSIARDIAFYRAEQSFGQYPIDRITALPRNTVLCPCNELDVGYAVDLVDNGEKNLVDLMSHMTVGNKVPGCTKCVHAIRRLIFERTQERAKAGPSTHTSGHNGATAYSTTFDDSFARTEEISHVPLASVTFGDIAQLLPGR